MCYSYSQETARLVEERELTEDDGKSATREMSGIERKLWEAGILKLGKGRKGSSCDKVRRKRLHIN